MEIIKYKTPSSILPLRRDFPLLNPPPLRGGGRVGEKSPEDNEKDISKAIQIIENGGVVICPTDTVYGLIADATNREAVEKVFEIKKRDKAKAISIFVKNIEEINKIASVNEKQYDFLKNNFFRDFFFKYFGELH